MPLSCRYFKDRLVPVSYENIETFKNKLETESLQIILVESGCITLRINRELCFLQAGALIFRNGNTSFEKLFSHNMVAKSITFEPEFINVNLSSGHILREEYDMLCKKYGYPSFHLFYDWSYAYTGVIPLNTLVCRKADALFSQSITEMEKQPDDRWSCRVRINVLELLKLAEEEYMQLIGKEEPATSLARAVLEYIHANYDKEITVEMLCEMYHTNHTTLLRDFRALTGTTIGQYILEYRLQLAKEALLFTALNVEEIAVKFGFRQSAYLSRVFKSRMGMTPCQFRSQMVEQRKNARGGFCKNKIKTRSVEEQLEALYNTVK